MKATVCSRWHNVSLVQAGIIKAFGWLARPGPATICEFSCLVSDHERRDPARHGTPARPSTRTTNRYAHLDARSCPGKWCKSVALYAVSGGLGRSVRLPQRAA